MINSKELYDFVSEFIESTKPSDGVWKLYFYYRDYDVTIENGNVISIEKARL